MQQVATAEFRTQCIFPAAGSSTTILVIEDERLVREATCEFLRAWRYRVLAACDGAVARKTFADHREEISLLVCDIVLPDGDGLELVSELCAASAGLRAVVVSGHPRSQKVDSRMFLAKPYSADSLLRVIKSALEEVRRSA
jgi:two-component system, cell cycle sensor histidine kinase and response regulator CckA